MPSDVELYQRTYSTLLRSRGETKLRILESSHVAIESSLHPLAGAEDLDLGAFLYATQRLPATIYQGRARRHGPGGRAVRQRRPATLNDWPTQEGPARRRQWHEGPDGHVGRPAVLAPRDVDDLIPTLVAYQIEWNKLRRKLNAIGWPQAAGPARRGGVLARPRRLDRGLGAPPGGVGHRVRAAPRRGRRDQPLAPRPDARRLADRLRAPDPPLVDARPPRPRAGRHRPRRADLLRLAPTPTPWSTSSPATPAPRESQLVEWVERAGPNDLKEELAAFREERTARLLEQLPVLPRPRAGPGRARQADAPLRRGGPRHPAPQLDLRPARRRAGHAAHQARRRPRWTTASATSTPRPSTTPTPSSSTSTTRSASRPTTSSPRSPPTATRCAASTSSARPRRSTPTSAT